MKITNKESFANLEQAVEKHDEMTRKDYISLSKKSVINELFKQTTNIKTANLESANSKLDNFKNRKKKGSKTSTERNKVSRTNQTQEKK